MSSPESHTADRSLGQALVGRGSITAQQLQAALTRQAELQRHGTQARLGALLVEWGWVGREEVLALTPDLGAGDSQPATRHPTRVDPPSGHQPIAASESIPIPPRLDPEDAAELRAALAKSRRSLVGQCVVLKTLGKGGMGQVFKAYDPRRQEVVAVKKVLGMGKSPNRLARFEREGNLAARLDHPGIGRIYETVIEGQDAPYMIQQLVRGQPLKDLIKTSMSAVRAAVLLRELCAAMACAHDQEIIHRDLKPENVLITPTGSAVILDFGLAKDLKSITQELTQTNEMLGTISYMAPEQLTEAKQAGPPADVYALGGILYACLAGQPPFVGATPLVIIPLIENDPPRPPSTLRKGVHPDLEAICLRCLEKAPADRYPGAREVGEALNRFLEGEGTAPRPRSRRLALGVLLVLAALGAAALLAPSREAPSTDAQPSGEDAARTPTPTPELPRTIEGLEAALTESPQRNDLRLALGRAYLARTDPAQALGHAESAIERDPGSSEAWLLKAHAQLQLVLIKSESLTRSLSPEPTEEVARSLRLARDLGSLTPLNEAWLAMAEQDLPRAGELLAPLENDPSGQVAFARAIHALWSRSKKEGLKKVRPLLDQTLQRAPSHLLARLMRGVSKIGVDVVEAEAELTAVIRLKPDVAQAYTGRARARILAKRLDEALADLNHSIGLTPHNPWALLFRGFVRVSKRDIAGAIADYTTALKQKPEFAPALGARANARERMGDLAGSLADHEQAVAIDPSADRHYNRGRLKAILKDTKGAWADYDKAIEANPKLARAWGSRAQLRYEAGQVQGALEDINQCIALDPDRGDSYATRASLWLNLNKIRKARDDLKVAMARGAQTGHMFHVRGRFKVMLRRYQEALEDHDLAIEMSPGISGFHHARAVCYGGLKKWREALKDHDRAIEIGPVKGSYLFDRAFVKLNLEDFDGAIEDLDRGIKAAPTDARMWSFRGLLRGDHKEDLRGALADHDQAVRLSPDTPSFLRSRARALTALKEHARAVADYQRVLELAPKHPKAAEMRAYIRKHSGR